MSTAGSIPQEAQNKPSKIFSCVLCAQRKVKCDKKQPCSNCVKAGTNCIPGAPPKPRSRRRRAVETDLIGRLQRYEELLLRHGIKREELDNVETPAPFNTISANVHGLNSTKHSGIIGSGGLPHNLWTGLSDEILDASSDDEGGLTIHAAHGSLANSEPDAPSKIEFNIFDSDLSELSAPHPQPFQIFRLWQTFLDNVHPLIKIIHAPSIQQEISRMSGSPQNLARPMEALMFSIYSCAVASMGDEECMGILGENKVSALWRFVITTKRALMSAGLLVSRDTMVLQAFVLFLLSIRSYYDPQSLWILTGIAIRLGERLGLHQEAQLEKLPVFDAEYGRRLFWQIVILDGHTSGRARVNISSQVYLWDTKFPLNVNDADLDINMRELPKERPGVTDMVFCLVRCEFGNYVHNQAIKEGNNAWQVLFSQSASVDQKETFINKLENILEEKYAKYCNPAIPLQLLSLVMSRIIIGRLRLAARHPRVKPDRGAGMSQEEKDSLFALCLMMIDYDNQGHRLSEMRRFMWHVNANFQLDAIVYILNELRNSSIGDVADGAWRVILESFDHHTDVLTDTKNPLYAAVGKLVLKSWGVRESMFARLRKEPPEGTLPRPISVLRSQRSTVASPESWTTSPDQRMLDQPFQTLGLDPMENTPIDWGYWNDLINASDNMMGSDLSECPQLYDPPRTMH